MEFLCNEVLDQIMGYCDMWSSYQLACVNKNLMAIFVAKLECIARRGFVGLAAIIYNIKLPRGFAEVIARHYFGNLGAISMRPDYNERNATFALSHDAVMVDNTIAHATATFATINGLAPIGYRTGDINIHVMLNVRLSQEYLAANMGAISRLLFQLLNAGQSATVAAIVYLQHMTPEYIKRIVFGIFCDKVMHWLHPDFMIAGDDTLETQAYICNKCRYGNFNHYDIELANKLPDVDQDDEYLDHHIAYAYKYINYW